MQSRAHNAQQPGRKPQSSWLKPSAPISGTSILYLKKYQNNRHRTHPDSNIKTNIVTHQFRSLSHDKKSLERVRLLICVVRNKCLELSRHTKCLLNKSY